jgi:hypothetical protein
MISWSYCWKLQQEFDILRVSPVQDLLISQLSHFAQYAAQCHWQPLSFVPLTIKFTDKMPWFVNQLWVYISLYTVWHVMPCSLVECTSIPQEPAASVIYCHDGCSRSPWNVCTLLWQYMPSHSRRKCLHGQYLESLKSHLHEPVHNFCVCDYSKSRWKNCHQIVRCS